MILDKLFPARGIRNASFEDAWLRDVMVGAKSASGETVNSRTALGFSAYFASIRAISEDIAALPLKTYKQRATRGKDAQPAHPVYKLLQQAPSEEMTAMSFRETLTSHALGWKGGFAEIVRRGDGRPAALYPLDPNTVEIERSDRGAIRYRVNTGGQTVYLRSDQVLHVRGLGFDGVTQYVMSSIAKEGIGSALAAQKQSAAFFGNGAVTTGVIEVPGMMKDEALRHMRDAFADRHQGAANAYKPFVMENGAKWTQISADPEKSQLVNTQQFNVEDVARWFRVPPHIIGSLLRATNNNIEHQGIEYVMHTLLPWLKRWELEIKRKLFLPNEDAFFAEHIVAGLMRGDAAARSAYYNTRFMIGTLSQNDIRELENENPIDNGDTYYVPLNMTPSEIAVKGPQSTQPAPNLPQTPEKPAATPEEDDDTIDNRVKTLARVSDAHRGLLASAVNARLAFESDRVASALKRKDFAPVVEKFYADAADHVFAAVFPTIDAFCGSAWAILSETPMSEVQELAVHNKTKEISARHVAQSRAEMKDAAVVEKWGAGARASLFARDEIQKLSEWLVSLANTGE